MPEDIISFIVVIFVFIGIAVVAILMSAKNQEKRKQDFKKRSETWREDFDFHNRTSGGGTTQNAWQQPARAASAPKPKPAQSVSMQPQKHTTPFQTLTTSLDLNKQIRSELKSRLGELDGHEHAGDAFEERPDTFGSLGDITDEGCIELANVRFLTQIETAEGEIEQELDSDTLVTAIVFGDILNARRG